MSSNSIYTYEIPSYVYMHTNIITSEFYIGYRFRNVSLGILPETDLPTYICSSKIRSNILNERHNWTSEIIKLFYISLINCNLYLYYNYSSMNI